MVSKDLLSILACPVCKGDVKQEGDTLVCVDCGRKYPIEDGIPNMLVEDSQ